MLGNLLWVLQRRCHLILQYPWSKHPEHHIIRKCWLRRVELFAKGPQSSLNSRTLIQAQGFPTIPLLGSECKVQIGFQLSWGQGSDSQLLLTTHQSEVAVRPHPTKRDLEREMVPWFRKGKGDQNIWQMVIEDYLND